MDRLDPANQPSVFFTSAAVYGPNGDPQRLYLLTANEAGIVALRKEVSTGETVVVSDTREGAK